MSLLIATLAATLLFVTLAFVRRPFLGLVASGSLMFGWWAGMGASPRVPFVTAVSIFAACVVVFGLPALRRRLVTKPFMPKMAAMLPRMGDTERIALEAGTVWWDGELFSGKPDWSKLESFATSRLSDRERQFLEGPVEEFCAMIDDWEISQAGDMPPEAWQFLKDHRFFGMIIPEEYGGLGFSALGHSAVIAKLASRSLTGAVTVMVPNSLGPAELLLHYGTEEQKRHFLPRLADGREIPCFGLTGPEAGSDAAATQSVGIVCRGEYEGREVLGMRLNWRKRYITLAPVSTVIGLAFKLRDPGGLLGSEEDLGITCALIPSDLPGVDIGDRHDPLGVPFHNGPTEGRDVFVPLEFIIGGPERAGQGWRMLMESLAAGRSISLPSSSVGGAQTAARLASAYAMVREQFDTPIGRFEGIEEPLARIGGLTYAMNAARILTASAVDDGQKPAVLSAIVKAWLTEGLRSVVNDAMDIRAGAAIMRGPRNVLARAYAGAPIGITVEGANILTRSMIIYGQGAIRCHPFVRDEMEAVADGDAARLDRALFGHVGFTVSNAVRALVLGLTRGAIARVVSGRSTAWHYRELDRRSAAFTVLSDAAMLTLGGQLKRREKLSGRLADSLAWMYLASAALKKFHDDGRPKGDLPFVRWSVAHALAEIDRAHLGILDNLPARPVAWALRWVVFPLGGRPRHPSDELGSDVAHAMLDDEDARARLTADIYLPAGDEQGLGSIDAALVSARASLAVERKIRAAVRKGRLDRAPGDILADRAVEAGIISREERETIREADAIRDEVIRVDAFARAQYGAMRR